MLGSSWVAAQLAASQEGLSSLSTPRWKFNENSHHSLYQFCYSWLLLYAGFLNSPACYRMIRRGRHLTPSPTNDTHEQSVVNSLLFLYHPQLHMSTSQYYQHSQDRHDTLKEETVPSYMANTLLNRFTDSHLLAMLIWNRAMTMINLKHFFV
jgi:hypothetical protein